MVGFFSFVSIPKTTAPEKAPSSSIKLNDMYECNDGGHETSSFNFNF